METQELREYANIKACTPEQLNLAFQILEVGNESKNKKVIMLFRDGKIDFLIACKALGAKKPTALRTADRMERGLMKIHKFIGILNEQ